LVPPAMLFSSATDVKECRRLRKEANALKWVGRLASVVSVAQCLWEMPKLAYMWGVTATRPYHMFPAVPSGPTSASPAWWLPIHLVGALLLAFQLQWAMRRMHQTIARFLERDLPLRFLVMPVAPLALRCLAVVQLVWIAFNCRHFGEAPAWVAYAIQVPLVVIMAVCVGWYQLRTPWSLIVCYLTLVSPIWVTIGMSRSHLLSAIHPLYTLAGILLWVIAPLLTLTPSSSWLRVV
jgi:hypothetical protein